jgi:hypothetical protein
MDSIHKDVHASGVRSSRRGVFPVLELLGVLVLIALIGACGTNAGTGNAPSRPGITSNGASRSAGTGNAGVTSSAASIGGDQVTPPSASVVSHSSSGYGLTPPPSESATVPPILACPTPESPGSESPGSESPGQACPTPEPPTPEPSTPAPASGLASVSYLDSPDG